MKTLSFFQFVVFVLTFIPWLRSYSWRNYRTFPARVFHYVITLFTFSSHSSSPPCKRPSLPLLFVESLFCGSNEAETKTGGQIRQHLFWQLSQRVDKRLIQITLIKGSTFHWWYLSCQRLKKTSLDLRLKCVSILYSLVMHEKKNLLYLNWWYELSFIQLIRFIIPIIIAIKHSILKQH